MRGPGTDLNSSPRAISVTPPSPVLRWINVAILLLAAGFAYWPSLSAPFVFDDLPGIVRNSTIRDLSAVGDVLLPAQSSGTSVVARPVPNLSLAINYALGGLNPRGYHVFNLLAHLATALALYGLVARTLALPRSNARFARETRPIAFGVALVWTLHPLQTESVTCVIQRTEVLVGLFYLLTFYAFVRSVTSPRPLGWRLCSGVACLLGMLTKEVMVSAPLLLFLYDRTFVAGNFREAWRQRGRFFLGLAATWIPLFLLVVRGEGRGGTVGFTLGVGAWDYLLTQCHALVLYLKLSLWPHPLVLDYGMRVVSGFKEVWLEGVLLLGLVSATVFALRRRPTLGFLGAWFFLILAPSSSFVPLATQTIAEHRMYLPLASVAVLCVLGLHVFAGRRVAIASVLIGVVLAMTTAARNRQYRSPLSIWNDTVDHVPDNARARYNLANALSAEGRAAEALPHYEAALLHQPGYAAAHYNLAAALLAVGREAEAVTHYQETLRLDPNAADAHLNLAAVLLRNGRASEAIAHYETASKLGPLLAEEHARFGRALAEANRVPAALAELQAALHLDPANADAHFYLGLVLSVSGRGREALPHFEEVVRQRPADFSARAALADTLVEAGQAANAIPHYEAILRAFPNDADIRAALDRARRAR